MTGETRIPMVLVFDPVNDLTLVEKLACAVGYSETWFDDLTLAVIAPSGMQLPMYMDLSHHECPLPSSYMAPCLIVRRSAADNQWSVYLIHH
jgi:hypothetical protein